MASLRDQVLGRYLDAAKVIAELPPIPPMSTDHVIETTRDADEPAALSGHDMRGAAMQTLLKRQAQVLMKIHNLLVEGSKVQAEERQLLQTRLNDLATISMSSFYAYRFDKLPEHWRQIYTDTLILISHFNILEAYASEPFHEDALDVVVEHLDRALITAGGAGKHLGASWIEKTLVMLEEFWSSELTPEERPTKRIRIAHPRRFSTQEPFDRPVISESNACVRHENWTLEKFEDYMNADKGNPRPVVFTDLIRDWPALTDHPWSSPDYLLSKTFGGRRLVPVEVGRSYVDQEWGQELIHFRDFLRRYMDKECDDDDTSKVQSKKTGYLAQHNLFRQIPSLRNDIQVPDFCWAEVPGHPTDPSKNQPTVDVPQLNAWFGPARTITPLHTDGYHNLLCQVVGTKYVRLYPPHATPHMRPRTPEHGVDMSNTSQLDVGVLEGWDTPQEAGDGTDGADVVAEMKESLQGVEYWECILTPGDTLLIPIGWWHYVRSLSISFSVSFWWN